MSVSRRVWGFGHDVCKVGDRVLAVEKRVTVLQRQTVLINIPPQPRKGLLGENFEIPFCQNLKVHVITVPRR